MKKRLRPLPNGWRWVTTKDVLAPNSKTAIRMGPFGSQLTIDELVEDGVFVIGIEHVLNKQFTDSGFHFINEEKFERLKGFQVQPGDVLMTMMGTMARTVVFPEGARKAIISSHLLKMTLCKDILPEYVALVLSQLSPVYRQVLRDSQGAIMGGLNTEIVKNLLFPLPPTYADQKRVVGLINKQLEEASRLRKAAERQKEAVMALQSARLREIFPRKEKMALPKGWEWKNLSTVCSFNPSKTGKRTTNDIEPTSFIPMEAVNATLGIVTNIYERPYREVSKGYTYFEDDDVLFAKITPCMQNGKICIARNLRNGFGFGTTEFHVLRPKEDQVLPDWVYYFLRTAEFRKRAEDHFTGSAGQQRVPIDFMEESLIPVPPTTDEQKSIINKLREELAATEMIAISADKELSAVEALPSAILREEFCFEKN